MAKRKPSKWKGMSKSGAVLACDVAPSSAISGPTQREDGRWTQKFRKPVIRSGEFHKTKDGINFTVSDDTLNHWDEQFDLMASNGIRVPVPSGHANWTDEKNQHGRVEDVFVEDGQLVSVIELEADTPEAIAAMAGKQVSIFVPPTYIDDKGNQYKYPIRHVALTDNPVIDGLEGFLPIAASNDADPVNVPVMKPVMKGQPTMDFTKIQKALGIDDELTEDNAESLILSAVEGMGDEKQKLADAEKQIKELKAKAKDAPKPLELSNTERVLSIRSLDQDLDSLVSSGRITPAVRDELKPHLKTDLMLSVDDDSEQPNYAGIIDALKKNDPVKLGEQSKAQTLKLSHNSEDGGGFDEDTHKSMMQMAGVKSA